MPLTGAVPVAGGAEGRTKRVDQRVENEEVEMGYTESSFRKFSNKGSREMTAVKDRFCFFTNVLFSKI